MFCCQQKMSVQMTLSGTVLREKEGRIYDHPTTQYDIIGGGGVPT